MLYTVQEASKLLNTSRVTIYSKMKSIKELKSHVKLKNKTQYITPQGVEIIRQSLLENVEVKCFTINEDECGLDVEESMVVNHFTSEQKNQEALFDSLKEQIKDLKSDKEKLQSDKDKLYNLLEQERQLHQNTQYLLKDTQESNRSLLMSVNNRQDQEIKQDNTEVVELISSLKSQIEKEKEEKLENSDKEKQELIDLVKSLQSQVITLQESIEKESPKGFWSWFKRN